MKTFIRKIDWLPFTPHGWGNGYVIIPKGHPYHGKSYGDIPVDVHGGLTFAENANALTDWPEITEKDKEGWVVGFDTAHYDDSISNWSRIAVIKETRRLAKQLKQLIK